MPITDPRAVKFANEVVRPLSEKLRDVFEDIARANQAWTDEVQPLIPNDVNEVLQDGRTAEGVTTLDGQEINAIRSIWVQLANFRAGSAVTSIASVDTKLTRACVRTLRS